MMIDQLDVKIFGNVSDYISEFDYKIVNYVADSIINDYDQKSVGIVVSGCIHVKKYLGDGSVFLLKRLEKSDIFGVSCVFNNTSPNLGLFECKTDCSIAYIAEDVLMRLFSKNQQMLRNYLCLLNTKICYLNKKIDLMTFGKVSDRLLAFLNELRLFQGNSEHVMLYYTKVELSEMLAIGRTSLYRAFEELEKRGFIKIHGNRVTILS